MSAAFYPQVQKIFVSYYGRPADPAGLQYWAAQLAANGGNLSAIIDAFGNSAESSALYAGATDSAKVTAIYQAMFARNPEPAGLAFYTNALSTGKMTASSIALDVANGAQGTDATYLANKVTVASSFTDSLMVDSAANVAYNGSVAAAAARSLISGVTTSASTANLASTIATIKAGGGASSGQTFTLTADDQNQNFANATGPVKVTISGSDDAQDGDTFTVTGSSYDDTFVVDEFLTLNINAGAGTDTLDASDVSSFPANVTTVDVNLATGVSSLAATFVGFENVIADDNKGGRLVGSDAANKFTLGEANDNIFAAGGDDSIYGDQDTYDTANDTLDGGSGVDTLYIDDDQAVTFGPTRIAGIEHYVFTGNGNDDVIVDFAAEQDAGTTGPSVAIAGGLRSVTFNDVPDTDTIHEVIFTVDAAADQQNLIDVKFKNVTHLTLTEAGGAGGGRVYISPATLDGVERVTGGLAGAASTDDLYLTGGTYNFSKVVFQAELSDDTTAGTGMSDVIGSDTKAETVIFGGDSNIGTLDSLDLGSGSGDIVTFSGVDVGDLRNFSTAAKFADVESVQFGSATYVTMEDVLGAAIDESIVGNDGVAADTLVFADTAGNGGDVDLSATAVSKIGTILIDSAANTDTSLILGPTSLESGATVVSLGSAATFDKVSVATSGVNVGGVTFKDFELLDTGAFFTTTSIATASGFFALDAAAGGRIIFSDSGTLTIRDDDTDFAGRIQGFTGDDTWTIASFAWNSGTNDEASIRTGAGNDTVILGAGNTYDTNGDSENAIMLEAGNDTLNINTRDVDGAKDLEANGGLGTDTILFSGARGTAGLAIDGDDLLATRFTGFEVLAVDGAFATGFEVELTAGDVVLQTIDLSKDTSAAGANTIDLAAYDSNQNYTLSVVGSAGNDTIDVGKFSTSVNGGAGDDTFLFQETATESGQVFTFTGGAGADTFQFDVTNIGNTVKITDFNSSVDAFDLADLSTAAGAFALTEVLFGTSVLNGILETSAASTAEEAANDIAVAAAAAGDFTPVGVFNFAGKTYLFADVDGDSDWQAASDLLVELVGNPTVAAENFILT